MPSNAVVVKPQKRSMESRGASSVIPAKERGTQCGRRTWERYGNRHASKSLYSLRVDTGVETSRAVKAWRPPSRYQRLPRIILYPAQAEIYIRCVATAEKHLYDNTKQKCEVEVAADTVHQYID